MFGPLLPLKMFEVTIYVRLGSQPLVTDVAIKSRDQFFVAEYEDVHFVSKRV